MSNPDLERARFALQHVQEKRDDNKREKYLIELRKLPARLHTSGLGQSVAFYLSEGKSSPEAQICGWLADWLGKDHKKIYIDQHNGLIGAITSDQTSDRYRRASAEARALAVWLKRFAEAFLSASQGAVIDSAEAQPDAAADQP